MKTAENVSGVDLNKSWPYFQNPVVVARKQVTALAKERY
jgi:hypothetical protein